MDSNDGLALGCPLPSEPSPSFEPSDRSDVCGVRAKVDSRDGLAFACPACTMCGSLWFPSVSSAAASMLLSSSSSSSSGTEAGSGDDGGSQESKRSNELKAPLRRARRSSRKSLPCCRKLCSTKLCSSCTFCKSFCPSTSAGPTLPGSIRIWPHSAKIKHRITPHVNFFQKTPNRCENEMGRQERDRTWWKTDHTHTTLSRTALSHTQSHTCSETSYRITDVECITRAKTLQLNLTGDIE